jgi:tape measure domain-containing protein
MTVRELVTVLGFKLNDAPIKKYNKDIDDSKKKTESLTAAFLKAQAIYGAATKIASGVFSVVRDNIVGVAAETERYRVVLGTMMGDQEKANKIIHDLDYSPVSDFYGTAKAIGGLQGMVTFGMQAEEASEILTRIGDVAQGNGEAFVSMSNNMGQVFAKGKADATDLKQFVMQGFDVVGEVAKQTGKSRAEIEKAGVSYEQTASALKALTSEGGKYFGMLAKQANTYSGLVNQFKSFIAATGEAIGTNILEPLKDVMRWILHIAKSFQDDIVANGTAAFNGVLNAVARCIVWFWIFQDALDEMGVTFEPIKKLFKDIFDFIGGVIESAMPFIINISATIIAAFKPIEAFVRPILEGLKTLFSTVFGDAAEKTNGLANAIQMLTPLFMVLGEGIGGIIKFLSPLAPVILGIVAAIKIWTIVQWLLNAAMMANPIGLIVAAVIVGVVLIVGLVMVIIKNWSKIAEFFEWLGGVIADAFLFAGRKIVEFFLWVVEGIKSIWNGIVDFFKKWGTVVLQVLAVIIFGIPGLIAVAVYQIIKHWDIIGPKVKAIWGKIKVFLSTVGKQIANIFFELVNKIKDAFQWVVDKAIMIWEKLKSWFSNLVEGIKNIWNGIVGFFSGLWNAIKEGPVEAIEYIRDAFSGLFDGIKEKFMAALNFLKEGWEKAKSFFSGIGTGIMDFFTGGGAEPEPVTRPVNDLIVTPEGNYSTHPDDFIMAMKNPASLIDALARFIGAGQPQFAYAGGGSLANNAARSAVNGAANYNSSNISNTSNITAPINVSVNASGMTPDQARSAVQHGVEAALREAINGSRGNIPTAEARRN